MRTMNATETTSGCGKSRRISIDPRLATFAAEAAKEKAEEFDCNSELIQSLPRGPIPVLTWNDVQVGLLLGKGGFNNVSAAHLKHPLDGISQQQEYAIKCLRNCILSRKESFEAGAQDLMVECKMLKHLDHEHIIRLHATSDESKAYVDGNPYFLLLERLTGTLEEQIRRWRWQEDHVWQRPKLSFVRSDANKERLYARVQSVAVPVAQAMEYLHSKHTIFRDLKPSNVGFDRKGSVKLFDFGLAREIKPSDPKLLTANTGSPLYMSPEVALGQPYGLEADVYSFGYFVCELTSLREFFIGMTAQEHHDKVLLGRLRPKVDAKCGSSRIQALIQEMWHHDASKRPSFTEIRSILQEESTRKLSKLRSSSNTDARVGTIALAKKVVLRAPSA